MKDLHNPGNEIRHRLRSGEQISGYSKLQGKSTFYSKDGFWWNGAILQFDSADLFTGLKDKNNRPLYEHDIIRIRHRNPLRKSELYRFVHIGGTLKLKSLYNDSTENISYLEKVKSFEWLSYAFINTDLIYGVNPT